MKPIEVLEQQITAAAAKCSKKELVGLLQRMLNHYVLHYPESKASQDPPSGPPEPPGT